MTNNNQILQAISQFPVINFCGEPFAEPELKFENFNQDTQGLIDKLKAENNKTIVVIDRGFSLKGNNSNAELKLVKDHINLSNLNPLIGPNDDTHGGRFFPVNKVYLQPTELNSLGTVVVAGLNPGANPKDNEKLVLKLQADYYCYNLVLLSLFAAHRELNVIGLILS
jgi:hypothetical protein